MVQRFSLFLLTMFLFTFHQFPCSTTKKNRHIFAWACVAFCSRYFNKTHTTPTYRIHIITRFTNDYYYCFHLNENGFYALLTRMRTKFASKQNGNKVSKKKRLHFDTLTITRSPWKCTESAKYLHCSFRFSLFACCYFNLFEQKKNACDGGFLYCFAHNIRTRSLNN